MNDKAKQEIIELLQAKTPDVKKAVELLTEHGTNKTEVRVYCGSPERYLMQIRWALAKAIGIGLADFQRGYFTKIRYQEEKDYPAVIIRIKEVLPLMMNEREALQKALVELGEANDEETKARAKELGESIDALAVRYELLHQAKEAYFNSEGELEPNEEELFPGEETEEGNQEPIVVKYDWDGDQVAAVKCKKNLESSLTKDRNRLKYQSPSAKDKPENPMPEGEERDKIVARIAAKEAELDAIASFLEPDKDAGKSE